LLRWLRLTRSSGFAQKPRPFFINTIIVGERPSDLAPDEAIAYDVASALVSGHVLPTLTYRRAVKALGESSAMELIYLVGLLLLRLSDAQRLRRAPPRVADSTSVLVLTLHRLRAAAGYKLIRKGCER
jgi:hypothetical protein